MGKAQRQRGDRTCDSCATVSTVLYRVKTKDSSPWQFFCKQCQQLAAQQNDYQYGGTWKQNKRN